MIDSVHAAYLGPDLPDHLPLCELAIRGQLADGQMAGPSLSLDDYSWAPAQDSSLISNYSKGLQLQGGHDFPHDRPPSLLWDPTNAAAVGPHRHPSPPGIVDGVDELLRQATSSLSQGGGPTEWAATDPLTSSEPGPVYHGVVDMTPPPGIGLGVGDPGSPSLSCAAPVMLHPFDPVTPPRSTMSPWSSTPESPCSPAGRCLSSRAHPLYSTSPPTSPELAPYFVTPPPPSPPQRRLKGASVDPKHAAGRNHVCRLCSSRFLCKSKLDRHMLTHTGVKPFGCFCGKRFNQKSSLKNHTRRHVKKRSLPTGVDVEALGLNGFSYGSLMK